MFFTKKVYNIFRRKKLNFWVSFVANQKIAA